jgi:hypothetical protein
VAGGEWLTVLDGDGAPALAQVLETLPAVTTQGGRKLGGTL